MKDTSMSLSVKPKIEINQNQQFFGGYQSSIIRRVQQLLKNNGLPKELEGVYTKIQFSENPVKEALDLVLNDILEIGTRMKCLKLAKIECTNDDFMRLSDLIRRDEDFQRLKRLERDPEFLQPDGEVYYGDNDDESYNKYLKTNYQYVTEILNSKEKIPELTPQDFIGRVKKVREVQSEKFRMRRSTRDYTKSNEVIIHEILSLAKIDLDLPSMILKFAFQNEPWFISKQNTYLRDFKEIIAKFLSAKWMIRRAFIEHYKTYILDRMRHNARYQTWELDKLVEISEQDIPTYCESLAKLRGDEKYVLVSISIIVSSNPASLPRFKRLVEKALPGDKNLELRRNAMEHAQNCHNFKVQLALEKGYKKQSGGNRKPRINLFKNLKLKES